MTPTPPVNRGLWLLATVPLLLAGASTPASALPAQAQAEGGTIDDPWCGDDGPMRKLTQNGAIVVFHPGAGCSQTFQAPTGTFGAATIRFYMTGAPGNLCGHFEFSGAIFGSSPSECAPGGQWVLSTFAVLTVTTTGGSYKVMWVPDGGGNEWLNAFVDYHYRL